MKRISTSISSIAKLFLVFGISVFIFLSSCKKKDSPLSPPTVTTGSVTNVTSSSADASGNITSTGNSAVTLAGFCFSISNAMPTVADDTINVNASSGIFSAELKNLQASKQYHLRAYAKNSAGISYGEVVQFNTGNAAPTVLNIMVDGTAQVAEKLTVSYTYVDPENDPEGETSIKWYRADDAAGTNQTVISEATDSTYTLRSSDEFKYIRIGITPKATTGTATGAETKSAFIGPIAEEPTTISFIYNGASVTYGIKISSVTGRRWLDRNLGAPSTPTSYIDFANYGDAFQWGRDDDGHQLVNRVETSAGTSGTSTTTTLSPNIITGHSNFIISGAEPFDWVTPQQENLWQLPSLTNNPCPEGWHIPDSTEWAAEQLTSGTLAEAFTQLNITAGGFRSFSSGNFSGVPSQGVYWTSTPSTANPTTAVTWRITTTATSSFTNSRATGALCRCIKNE